MVSATTSTGRRYRREIYLTIDGNAWEDHGCQGMRFGPSVWINGRLHHALAVEVMFVQQSDDKGANVLLEPAHEDNRREFDGIQALWSGFSETVDIEGVPYVVAIVPADAS